MNFSTGLFGDIATALTGCELEVTGEENLWTSRPCIFVFNHQSKADVMILAKLIRRDMGGVAKKEVRDTPVIGKLMELAGTVFIDRANAGSAIKAMAPLIDAVKIDGKSIVIAPEGTRTLSPKLGPFKKGAFHMAIQAGVPMVPIVIHNAGDVAPKNEFLMRPAKVRVDVLPAVDTSKWSVRTMNQHVAEVRGMFLEALGQAEEEDALEALVNEERAPAKKASGTKRTSKPATAAKQPAAKKTVARKKPAIRKAGAKKMVSKKSVAKQPANRSTPNSKAAAAKSTTTEAAE
jgi:putative phosphoserine phosphatase/1-acylglycerol-3-phosphate O-acyltransferase